MKNGGARRLAGRRASKQETVSGSLSVRVDGGRLQVQKLHQCLRVGHQEDGDTHLARKRANPNRQTAWRGSARLALLQRGAPVSSTDVPAAHGLNFHLPELRRSPCFFSIRLVNKTK